MQQVMTPSCLRLARPATARSLLLPVRSFSSTSRLHLKLAYDLYEPPAEKIKSAIGNPVVFVHGLFGSKKNNRSMSKVLSRDLNRPIYAIDLRNHGDSPHDPRHDYEALGDDIESFISEHKLQDTTLIGHSMGAKACMVVALRSPALVANLIPIDNAPVDAALKSDFGKYVKGMQKVEQAKITKQSEADAILAEYEESLPVRQFLLTNLVRLTPTPGAPLVFRIPINIIARSLDNMADFPYKDPDEIRFNKPTLFVRGTKSHYISDEVLPTIGRFFPKFELADVEAGHWVVSEKPAEFREKVVAWMEEKV